MEISKFLLEIRLRKHVQKYILCIPKNRIRPGTFELYEIVVKIIPLLKHDDDICETPMIFMPWKQNTKLEVILTIDDLDNSYVHFINDLTKWTYKLQKIY